MHVHIPSKFNLPHTESLIDRESSIRSDSLWRTPCFDDRRNNLCMVEQAFPCLLVHIVNLENFGSHSCNWKEIQSDKSFAFALTSCNCDYMTLLACFPIMDAHDTRVAEVDQEEIKVEGSETIFWICTICYYGFV